MSGVAIRAPLRAAFRLDRDGLDVAAGLRVAVCVVVPVALGLLSGRNLDGTVAALGALNVAVAEGVGYSSRALILGGVLSGNTVGVAPGTVAAMTGWWAVAILFGWVLVAAYVGVIGPVTERIGWFAALMFMIGLGLPEPSLAHAVLYGGFAAAGGLWAVAVIVALWPFHPHRPVLRAVGRALISVSKLLELSGNSAPADDRQRAVARAEERGHEAGAITRWRTVRQGRRRTARHLRQLAVMVERARSDAVVLDHRLGTADSQNASLDEVAATREAALGLGRGLAAVGDVFQLGREPCCQPGVAEARRTGSELARTLSQSGVNEAALRDLCGVLAALTRSWDDRRDGDQRAAGGDDDSRQPPTALNAWGALRANLTVSSFWFR